MIEKVSKDGFGQGSCDACEIIKGWHREWSTSLYYIRNENGVYLRLVSGCSMFSNDVTLKKVCFCYEHALISNDIWKVRPAYKQVFKEEQEDVE